MEGDFDSWIWRDCQDCFLLFKILLILCANDYDFPYACRYFKKNLFLFLVSVFLKILESLLKRIIEGGGE